MCRERRCLFSARLVAARSSMLARCSAWSLESNGRPTAPPKQALPASQRPWLSTTRTKTSGSTASVPRSSRRSWGPHPCRKLPTPTPKGANALRKFRLGAWANPTTWRKWRYISPRMNLPGSPGWRLRSTADSPPIDMAIPRSRKAIAHLAVDELRERLRTSNTARQFGFVLREAEPGRVVLQMRVREKHKQVHGVVHGGVIAALADTAGGLATYMACPRGTRIATVEMKINYLEGVEGGAVRADARVVRLGAHIAVVECDVRDDTLRLVGKALMTFFVGPFRKRRKKPH